MPISPHITIYKIQINMVISMMHRITGMGLFLASIFFPWIYLANLFGLNIFNYVDCECKIILYKLFLFCLTYALIYHISSGIRHLFYDKGYGFSIKATNISAWAVLISSFLITIMLWNFKLVSLII